MYCLSARKVALILYSLKPNPADHISYPASRGHWRKTARLQRQEGTFSSHVLYGPVVSRCVCRSPSSTELWGGGGWPHAQWQVSLSVQLRCSPSSAASEYHRNHDFQGQPAVNCSFAGSPLRFPLFLLRSLCPNRSNLLAARSISIILGVLFLLLLVVSHFLIQLTILCTNLFNLVSVF